MNINKGSLELSDSDFDNIISNIMQGNNTLRSLEIELYKNGLSFKDFQTFSLMVIRWDIKHIDIYTLKLFVSFGICSSEQL